MSEADPRQRHRGLSHHTGTIIDLLSGPSETGRLDHFCLVIEPTDFACVKIDGAPSTSNPCGKEHDFIRVTARSTYTPLTFLGMGGPITLTSTSTVEISE